MDSSNTGSSSVDAKFDLLKESCRRDVLYLLRGTDDVFSYDEVVDHLSKRSEKDETQIKTSLEHVHLPKLDDYEVIDYNQDLGLISYNGDEELEKLLDVAEELER